MESSQCSGRSLATILVAWMGAAMVASILLRWKYMWIALAVLTLAFLIASVYAACSNRRRYERRIIQNGTVNTEQQRERNIQSVYWDIDNSLTNCPRAIIEPPAYQTYWITDLPPPYAVVIHTADAPTPSTTTTPTENIQLQTLEPRLLNPPPYSATIQPDHTLVHSTLVSQTIRDHHHHYHHDCDVAVSTNSPTISRRQLPPVSETNNRDKDMTGSYNEACDVHSEPIVYPDGAHYLSNSVSDTFGQGAGNDTDRNVKKRIVRERQFSHSFVPQENSICTCDKIDNNIQ